MRHFGSIRELPSGRFQARYRPNTGKHVIAPHTFETREQAEDWLNALEREHRSGTTPQRTAGE